MGPYLTAARGVSSREELAIDWEYPVYERPTDDVAGRSRARDARTALALEEAFAYIAADDPRPLLVLRECVSCTKTDDALMTRQADNEKTMLMSRWFHCVKLPPDVLDEGHPFHNLFAGKKPAHLFVAQPDGASRVNLRGDQSRTELWKSMGKLLASSYEDPPKGPLKNLARILDRYDEIDRKIADLGRKRGKIIEKQGTQSSKYKKVAKELNELRANRAKLRTEAIGVSKLKLAVRDGQKDSKKKKPA